MNLLEVTQKAKDGLHALTRSEISNVTAVSKIETGWRALVELVERRSIPDTQDLLGVYEVILDCDGNIMNYERKRVRRRQDLDEAVE